MVLKGPFQPHHSVINSVIVFFDDHPCWRLASLSAGWALHAGRYAIVPSQETCWQRNVSQSQYHSILLSWSRENIIKVQFTSPCLSMVPLASVVWANSSPSPFICKGTKEKNNICIFHCNSHNMLVGSVARRGFGELFSCSGLNDKLFLQKQSAGVIILSCQWHTWSCLRMKGTW